MIEIALMIEGQMGLTWPIWKQIVRAVEDLGFAGLYRSDHFTGSNPPDQDSLELWVSLTWLADHTKRIEFGPLVTPVSYRHPAMTTRMAIAVDELSNGRFQLGLGAGWQEREHHNYGFDLLSVGKRFKRFEEGLQIITHLLKKDEPLTFDGEYYHMHEAVILPRPHRVGGPPIVIGGNGPKLTIPLAAHYADEWNCIHQTPEQLTGLNKLLDEEIKRFNRKPSDVRRTMMTGLWFAQDEKALNAKLNGKNPDELRSRGLIVGTPEQITEQLTLLEQAGLQRIMLQWLDLNDMNGLELLARALIKS